MNMITNASRIEAATLQSVKSSSVLEEVVKEAAKWEREHPEDKVYALAILDFYHAGKAVYTQELQDEVRRRMKLVRPDWPDDATQRKMDLEGSHQNRPGRWAPRTKVTPIDAEVIDVSGSTSHGHEAGGGETT